MIYSFLSLFLVVSVLLNPIKAQCTLGICQNGGICLSVGGSTNLFTCLCKSPYFGSFCQLSPATTTTTLATTTTATTISPSAFG